jgi:predicted peptidase
MVFDFFVSLQSEICNLRFRDKMKNTILTVVLLTVIFPVFGQVNLFEKKQFIYKNDTLPYRILYPENYDKSKNYPLLVFLHGAGERGNDNEMQLVHGSKLFTDSVNRAKYPAIVVFPQCPLEGFWAPIKSWNNGFEYVNNAPVTEPMQLVIRLIRELKKTESVDDKRMYVAGLSMGGMGTYDLICRYPRMFAAAVPICGGVSINRLKKVKNVPIRIFHGGNDPVVSPDHSRKAYKELLRLGAKKVTYIEFPGVQHDSWNNAFAQPDFLSWIFSNKKK